MNNKTCPNQTKSTCPNCGQLIYIQKQFQIGELLNRSQIAKFIKVSERSVSLMMTSRRIPYFKLGKAVRFDPVRVREALNKYEVLEV